MLATGVAGGIGTFTNISSAYGKGTAAGAVAAGEGATAVLALVLLGLTMLGQSSPWPVRAGLWLLPAAASCMAAMAAADPGQTVIYAVTPMGMCVAAEGMAFLARRIVVHTDGRDAEAERRNALTVQRLAYHRARAANHPDEGARKRSDKASWRLAKRVGVGDVALGARLVEVQRDRLRDGADASLADMFGGTSVPQLLPAEPVEELPAAVEDESAPDVVPAGVVTLPIVARPEPVAEDEPVSFEEGLARVGMRRSGELVTPKRPALAAAPFRWEDVERAEGTAEATSAVAAEQARQVVTETVTLTPADLRRKARQLNREAVKSTRRPVTIKALQDGLNLSRRDAAELRREVVEEARS
ncbi:conjugal transfer protein [Streptomyces sp. NPDC006784]|uniref:conjugal transfer protein n=1 Tax=Streptomyces sp. NPDC006784 TaxID=3364764 RepID=UPI0036A2B63F